MKQKGFTLMELMIVVAIVGIIAAIAYPSYQESVRKSNRTDAKAAIMALKLAQEKLRANCATYANTIGGANDCANTTVEGSATSSEGYYSLALSNVSGTSYTITATAVAGKIQAGDTGCTTLNLTVNGTYPDGLEGPSAAVNCW